MQVHHLLENAAIHNPSKGAIWFKNQWYSYGELNSYANRIAQYIHGCGIKKGDRIAILHENSFAYAASYFAILKTGAIVVAINTDSNSESLSYLLNDSDSKFLISQKKFRKHIIPALENLPELSHLFITDGAFDRAGFPESYTIGYTESLEPEDKHWINVRTIDIDLAEIVYTSGSTGNPKGVMLTHLNLVSNMMSICSYLKLTEKDRIMVVLPFYYIYGKSLLLTHIMTGASIVIDNSFVFPNKVLETMVKTEVTGFAGVPSTFMILLNRSLLRETQFSRLRYVTQAGGSMAPSVQKEVVDAFSPADVFIMYGATEAAPRLSYLEPDLLFSKWGSIGVPVDNVELLICDSDGNTLPFGEVGEIVARGSNIMKGYWNDPEETAKVLKNGLYFTGDLGRQDEEGFFYVVGRTKEMIKVKGFRVGIKEIEECILELDQVHETAVFGIDDPILGEAILALIIPKDKGWDDRETVKEHLQAKLTPIKQPKYIEFRDSFLKNESGKILKMQMKDIENKIKREK